MSHDVLNGNFHFPSTVCFICKMEREALEHVFLKCPLIVQTWSLAPWPLQRHLNLNAVDWIKVILELDIRMGLPAKQYMKHIRKSLVVVDGDGNVKQESAIDFRPEEDGWIEYYVVDEGFIFCF